MSSFGKYFEPARTAIINWLWSPSSAAQYQWRHRVSERAFLALAKRKIARESGTRPQYLVLRPRPVSAGLLRAADGRSYRWFPVLKNGYSSILHMLTVLHGARERYSGRPLPGERDETCKIEPVEISILGRTETVEYPRAFMFHFLLAEAFCAHPRADIRFCVLRHPLDRFVSVYRNHVLRARFRPVAHPYKKLLSPDAFCAELEKEWDDRPWEGEAKNIRGAFDYAWDMHLWPQHFFLGRDASYFTHIFTFADLSRIPEFLSELHRQRVKKMARVHKSGSMPMPHLSASLRRRVEALYKDDMEIFGRHMPPPQV